MSNILPSQWRGKSREIYDLRHGGQVEAFTCRLSKRLTNRSWCFMPVHIRHHWVAGFFLAGFPRRLIVCDSAPSKCTRHDLEHLARRLHVSLDVIAPFRQPRDSLECGLHVILWALYASQFVGKDLSLWPTHDCQFLSLEPWRALLSRTSSPMPEELVASLPQNVRELAFAQVTARDEKTAAAVTGGSPKAHALSTHYMVDVDELADRQDPIRLAQEELATALSKQRILQAEVDEEAMLTTETVDALLQGAFNAAQTAGWSLVSVASSQLPKTWRMPIVVPRLFFQHYVLIVARENTVTTYDSIAPHHDAKTFPWLASSRSFTAKHFKGISTRHVFTGPQPRNACGLFLLKGLAAALSEVGVPCSVDFSRRAIAPILRRLSGNIERLRSFLDTAKQQPQEERAHGKQQMVASQRAESLQLDRPPQQKGMPIPALRDTLRSLRSDDIVDVSLSTQSGPQRWCGRVVRPAVVGRWSCQVAFSLRKCPDCNGWRSMPTVTLSLPHAQHRIESLSAAQVMTNTCNCVEPAHDAPPNASAETRALPDRVAPSMLLAAQEEYGSPLMGACATKAHPPLGHVVRTWKIYSERPPHVHALAWNAMSDSTRRSHIKWLRRLQAMPRHLRDTPAGTAAVEIVLALARARQWRPATTTRALSDVTAALKALPLYSDATQGINIAQDPAFAAAAARAQHLARIVPPKGPIALTSATFRAMLAQCEDPELALFLELTWFLAGRAGDVRQLAPADVEIQDPEPSAGRKPDDVLTLSVTYRRGKSASFRGAYTVHTTAPRAFCKRLAGWVRNNRPFARELQQRAAQLLKRHGAELRSIRKGRLIDLATRGALDADLMRLSGHKSVDTLHRYLGFGRDSTDGKNAAQRRASLKAPPPTSEGSLPFECPSGSTDQPPVGGGIQAVSLEPLVMGPFSGTRGTKGQRRKPDPHFIPLSPPSNEELGIRPAQVHSDRNAWPLHAKHVGTIDWDAVGQLISDTAPGTAAASHLDKSLEWLQSDEHYAATSRREESVPLSVFTDADVETLLECGKIEWIPEGEHVKGFIRGFTVDQSAKERRRPIFDPLLNDLIDRQSIPIIAYPSRRERRDPPSHVRQYDFAAYFDQFAIPVDLRNWFVGRVRHKGTVRLYRITRMPMGAAWSPVVAQSLTWVLTEGLNVRVDTMIDNVRLSSDNLAHLEEACKTFLARVGKIGATLNDDPDPGPRACHVFLGEEYVPHGDSWRLRNSAKVLDKLRKAAALFQKYKEGKCPAYSRRQFAAFAGLLLFAADTVDVKFCDLFDFLRGYSAITTFDRCNDAKDSGWQTPVPFVSDAATAQIQKLVEHLLQNATVKPVRILHAPSDHQPFDVVIVCDASAVGWGAHVWFRSGNDPRTEVWQRNWSRVDFRASASAEPAAVSEILEHLTGISHGRSRSWTVAVVTDHHAIVLAQRQPLSGYRGFGRNFFLNRAFQRAYSDFADVKFYFIEGCSNPADEVSRACYGNYAIHRNRRDDALIPALQPPSVEERPEFMR